VASSRPLPGGRKQALCALVAQAIRRPVRRVSNGKTEPKQTFIDVVEALGLPISTELRKPWLGQAIVEYAGLTWDPDCDSRNSPSGGGDNVRVEGLERLLQAVLILLDAAPTENGAAQIAVVDPNAGVVAEIRLRKAVRDRATALADDAFAERADPARQRLLLEKALAGHHELTARLINILETAGFECQEDPRSVDLVATRANHRPVLIEVKTIPDHAVCRARLTLAQLYEYAYRLGNVLRDPILVLAADRSIRDPRWLRPYLIEDRTINVLWAEGMRLHIAGPDAAELHHSVPELEAD